MLPALDGSSSPSPAAARGDGSSSSQRGGTRSAGGGWVAREPHPLGRSPRNPSSPLFSAPAPSSLQEKSGEHDLFSDKARERACQMRRARWTERARPFHRLGSRPPAGAAPEASELCFGWGR